MRRFSTRRVVRGRGLGSPSLCAAQSVSASDREALVRLRVDRGGRADEVDVLILIRQVDEVAAKGLPAGPLTNKIREGLAKGVDPKRIELVIRQMATHLETADRLMREMESSSGGTGTGARSEADGSLGIAGQVDDLGR